MTDMRLLIADGTPVPLTSKAFDTLVVLIENRDRVVTKDELLRSVWPDVDVEEGNLTQQIFLLRKALGETAQQPRYIVTVPGHGYRFTARVNGISDDSAAPASTTDGAVVAAGRCSPQAWPLIRTGLAAFGVIAFLAIVLGSEWMPMEQGSRTPGLHEAHHQDHRKRQGHEQRHVPRRPVRRLCGERRRSVQPVGATSRHRREDASRSTPAARH